MLFTYYTFNSIKVVFPEAQTVNYERPRDDGIVVYFGFNKYTQGFHFVMEVNLPSQVSCVPSMPFPRNNCEFRDKNEKPAITLSGVATKLYYQALWVVGYNNEGQ